MSMRIISIRRGFACDHSSTSYEFLAVDKPLDKEARKIVGSLSRRAHPTPRRVGFVYHVDGYDIPGGWQPLLREYYDVMYSESYDWWLLAFAFNASPEQQDQIAEYEFEDENALGISTYTYGKRTIVAISCRINREFIVPIPGYEDDLPWDMLHDDPEAETQSTCYTDDFLLALLCRIRQQLIEGDYRCLAVVWEAYGDSLDSLNQPNGEQNADNPPVSPNRDKSKAIVDYFRDMLDEF